MRSILMMTTEHRFALKQMSYMIFSNLFKEYRKETQEKVNVKKMH